MSTKAVTSKRVAAEASDVLRTPSYRAKPKSVAGSALAQAPDANKNKPRRYFGQNK